MQARASGTEAEGALGEWGWEGEKGRCVCGGCCLYGSVRSPRRRCGYVCLVFASFRRKEAVDCLRMRTCNHVTSARLCSESIWIIHTGLYRNKAMGGQITRNAFYGKKYKFLRRIVWAYVWSLPRMTGWLMAVFIALAVIRYYIALQPILLSHLRHSGNWNRVLETHSCVLCDAKHTSREYLSFKTVRPY